MSYRIETVWRLIPLHNQSRSQIFEFSHIIQKFCGVIENKLADFVIPVGWINGQRALDDWQLTTTSPEDEGMIRLYCGANYDLEMLSQSVIYSP